MSNTDYYEFIVGAAGVFLVLVIVQFILARTRKKNLKELDYWYEIYRKQESEEEFNEIYSVNRPKAEQDSKKDPEGNKSQEYLKIRNRKLEINSEGNTHKAKPGAKGKDGKGDKRDSPMIQPHKR